MKKFIEQYFKIKESGSTLRTEVVAGITTFMTMAYILAVNPLILADAGMDKGGVFTATILAAVIGTLIMALFARYPFALAPGMGLNAFFAYGVVLGMGYSWQTALTAVFVEGLIFIFISLFQVREKIFEAIPLSMKHAVTVGIGLFIALIGLKNAGVVIQHPATLVTKGALTSAPVMLALLGTIATVAMMRRQVKGALLLGILLTYGAGLLAEFTGWYQVNPEIKQFSLIPNLADLFVIPSLESVAFKIDFHSIFSLEFIVIIFAFLFVDLFDTIGTVIGVSDKAGYLTKEGKLPRLNKVLLSDAIATSAGALLGTSTTTTFIESASGVAAGGRTGFTSVITALFFLLSLMFAPIFLSIPAFATAPALIVVGLLMFENIKHIQFSNFEESLPAYFTIIMMPFTFSIAEGIVFGIISFVVLKMILGKFKEVSIVMYILALLFVLSFYFLK
jgi:AGZA family xanthine/uracil permease-like MFS transporter